MKQAVVSVADDTALVWSPETLQVLGSFPDCRSPLGASLAASAGGFVALQQDRSRLRHFCAAPQHTAESETGGIVNCVAAWRHVLALGFQDGHCCLWDSRSGRLLVTIPGKTAVFALFVTDRAFLSGHGDGSVHEYLLSALYGGATDSRFTYSAHQAAVIGLHGYRGAYASASRDQSLAILSQGATKQQFRSECEMTCVQCDGKKAFAGSSDGSVLKFAGSVTRWKWQTDSVTAMSVLTNGLLLVAARCVYLVATSTGRPVKTFDRHTTAISAMTLIEYPSQGEVLPLDAAAKETISLEFPAAAAPPQSSEEDVEKLRTMNQWIYNLCVDAWL